MKFTNLFSSSKGNSLLVESDNARILVDAGLSGKTITEELKKLDIDIKAIDGIFVTHEHSDHIKGAGVLSRKGNVPIYGTKGTIEASLNKLGKIAPGNLNVIKEHEPFVIKDLNINAFSILHDCEEPVGFTLTDGKKKIGIATDMGTILEDVVNELKSCEFVFLEANHDVSMLKNGRYPMNLKQRILSPLGHLSNEESGGLLAKLVQGKTTRVRLGHLSEENNLTSIAYKTVSEVAYEDGVKVNSDYELDVANRAGINGTIEIL